MKIKQVRATETNILPLTITPFSFQYNRIQSRKHILHLELTLVIIGGGALCGRHFLFIFFLLHISPLDQTLRPICKFLILGIFYHTKKSENLI